MGVAFKDKRGIWEWGQGKRRERIFHAAENQDEVSYQHQRLVHFFKEAGFFFSSLRCKLLIPEIVHGF